MQPIRSLRHLPIEAGDKGVDETIAGMVAVVEHAAKLETVKAVAANVLVGVDPLNALYDFMVRRMTYRDDPDGVELLQHPQDLLADMAASGRAFGDCDDLAMLGAAMLLAGGFAPVLMVVGKEINGPFVHVFYGVQGDDGGVLPFDPQERIPAGQLPRVAKRVKVYDV